MGAEWMDWSYTDSLEKGKNLLAVRSIQGGIPALRSCPLNHLSIRQIRNHSNLEPNKAVGTDNFQQAAQSTLVAVVSLVAEANSCDMGCHSRSNM